MKKRILILLVVLAATLLAFSPLCRAQASLAVYGYTDQVYYKPGDTGTLNFWIYNSGNVDLILENVTIIYPWYSSVGLWGGNETITPSTSTVIKPGGNWSGTSSFTVPNDGRVIGIGSSISITVVTEETTQTSYLPISLASVPAYFSLQNLDQLMTWLMVLVVIIVICTLIIAAAIFLAVRRRQMTWKQEAKPS